ncbi:hypothetical protein TPA0910_39850 [Streptomyces hygroscopicus subsp. sporocinereus]|uniref:Uncharacterized protein n=1 Tax=Streptomyces hygroscopicus TaxID=1912 RepID=A0ABQ3U1R0_STRHY|nr:hypothetical protein TPA0910_39850 [Streptomyces hygroscopicus]
MVAARWVSGSPYTAPGSPYTARTQHRGPEHSLRAAVLCAVGGWPGLCRLRTGLVSRGPPRRTVER